MSGNAVDSTTQILRNQSTRQFWDTNYVDPSWINSVIDLIPRMQSWVATYYPGIKIGITEYNWGAESSINGATAQADILGIFGRQSLNLATRWTTPDASTPTYLAIKMYRNYNGSNSTFGDTSVSAGGPNPDNVAVFGATRADDGALTIMVISKYLSGVTPLALTVTNFANAGVAHVWQLNSSNVIAQLNDLTLNGSVINTAVPGQSVTLLTVVPPMPAATLLQLARRARTGSFNSRCERPVWPDLDSAIFHKPDRLVARNDEHGDEHAGEFRFSGGCESGFLPCACCAVTTSVSLVFHAPMRKSPCNRRLNVFPAVLLMLLNFSLLARAADSIPVSSSMTGREEQLARGKLLFARDLRCMSPGARSRARRGRFRRWQNRIFLRQIGDR